MKTKEPKIEKGIPVPAFRRTPGSVRDTIARMEDGDSVIVESRSVANGYAVAMSVISAGKYKAVTRKLGNEKFRVWKIKK